MNRSFSFASIQKKDLDNISEAIKNASHSYSHMLFITTRAITNVMKSSRGRSKFFGMIQYTAKLVYYCQIYSNIEGIKARLKKEDKAKFLISGRIMTNLRKNRKIFKLLKFVEEIQKLEKIKESKEFIWLKIARTLIYLMGAMSYISDNLMWCSDTKILRKIKKLTLKLFCQQKKDTES